MYPLSQNPKSALTHPNAQNDPANVQDALNVALSYAGAHVVKYTPTVGLGSLGRRDSVKAILDGFPAPASAALVRSAAAASRRNLTAAISGPGGGIGNVAAGVALKPARSAAAEDAEAAARLDAAQDILGRRLSIRVLVGGAVKARTRDLEQ